MSVICTLTAQNTRAVTGIYPVSPEFISLQIDVIMEYIGVDAVKIGILHSPEVITTVAERLKHYGTPNIVVDPVMVSTCGDKLLQDDAVDALKTILFPIATVITPNLPEAAILLHQPAETLLGADISQLETACKTLSAFGAPAIVLKGGHAKSHRILDLLYTANDGRLKQFESARIDTRNTHGTGARYPLQLPPIWQKAIRLRMPSCWQKTISSELWRPAQPINLETGTGLSTIFTGIGNKLTFSNNSRPNSFKSREKR